MQQVIEFESSAKQQPIDVRATIQRTPSLPRPLQKDGSSNPRANFSPENLHIHFSFVSLQCQTAETNVFDERELAKYPSSFAFQPHKILTAAFHEDSAFRSILRCLTTRKRSRFCVRTSRKLATSNSEK
ncbi:hypothetical protein HMPREF3034_00049 [Prevotella sp. DNF00663]|nr:hypothetical protein HMPREF3034_00049 [Prevotella sp. DNF00663]